MVIKLVIQIVLDCAPLGSAGKGPLLEMVKDDGACACHIEIAFDCGGDEKSGSLYSKGSPYLK